MSLAHSQGMPVGTPAPPFSLPATDGKTYTPGDFAAAKVLVVVFTCNHCPYAQAAEARLVALQAGYAGKGVQLVAINPNDAKGYPEDSFEKMVERAKDQGFNFPYLCDESQKVARAYCAVCTPDVFVFDAARKLVYNGRIDDNWKNASAVTRHDLVTVLDATLEGRAPALEVVASMGCSIKWRSAG